MTGTITRWGAKGYGFVKSAELESEAWLHAKFIDDASYEPQQGDVVDFTPEKLPDGRYQARRVRLVQAIGPAPARRESSRPSRAAYSESSGPSGFGVKLSLGGIVLPPSRPSAPASYADRPADSSMRPAERAWAHLEREPLGAPSQAEQRAFEPPRSRPELPVRPVENAEVGALARSSEPLSAITAPASMPSPASHVAPPAQTGTLVERIAYGRTEREERLAELRARIEATEAELREAESRLSSLRGELAEREVRGPVEEAELLESWVRDAAAELEQGVEGQRRQRDAVELARRIAIQRCGLPPVEEYEEARKRLAEATSKQDEFGAKAFRTLERAGRMSLRELAEAMDRQETAPALRARFAAFAGNLEPGLARVSPVIVAPIRSAALDEDGPRGDLARRMAIAFWHASEKAARELGGNEAVVEHGVVWGSVAVRCAALDAQLFPLILDEAWAARPPLVALGATPHFELLEGQVPAWESEPDEPSETETARPARDLPVGRSLSEAAVRLDLSLHDLVALLFDRGLPFPDDTIDLGTEETIRALLGGDFAEAPDSRARPPATPSRPSPPASPVANDLDLDAPSDHPLGAGEVASRMLRKLLRDRRVGGRHTRVEHAYGHHFSDEEKNLARRVAEWLEKDGIFLPKLNEGAHHISINPRRLRDVGQIIDGNWERRADLDAVT